MTKNYFVSLALLVGMASPAFAQGTRTINVWGSEIQLPAPSSLMVDALVSGPHQVKRPTSTAGGRGIDLGNSDFRIPSSSVRWTGEVVNAARINPNIPLYADDEDGGNARNPALPPYERGRGQETGGPARNLIPN